MLHISSEGNNRNGYIRKSPLTFLSSLFKRKKYHEERGDVKFVERTFGEMERGGDCPSVTSYAYGIVPRVPSSLSVTAVDIMVQAPCCPPSPAVSTLTLTPGRTRDIDQDMAALRLSRQDNPFLQVLASRESLVDSLEESESDDANLMSQEFPPELDVDPLTLPEIHEHMIRSPPPITWPKSPNFKLFRFPMQSSDDDSSQESLHRCGKRPQPRGILDDCLRELSAEAIGPVVVPIPRTPPRPASEARERGSSPFCLLAPEVRRKATRSADDGVHLMAENDEQERRRLLAKRPS